MKVFVALTYYTPHWTGLTAHAVRIAEELAARGHEVTVLATRHLADLPSREMRNGVEVVRVAPAVRLSRGLLAPAFPAVAARLIGCSDVVQIHSPLPEAPILALLARLLGKPVVLTHHADVVMPPGLANRLIEHAAFALLASAARLSAAVTSYSRDYADHSFFLGSFTDRLVCIPPPVRLPEPRPGAAQAWRAELGLGEGPVIGFAGRWVEEKGFDVLLRAVPALVAALPHARLVYAGEPEVPYEDFFARCRPLLAPVRDRVTFLGLLLDRQRLADFYALCDVFVLPSRSDMMALVQIEAMLSGVPVVASDVPGARVPVHETGFGRLVPPGDPDALAAALVDTLGHRERYRPRRSAVVAAFDPDRSLDLYEDLLARVVRESR